MTRLRLLVPLLCLVVLHTPDGKELRVDSHHIVAVRPATNVKQHLAPGTETVIYMSGQNFGVTETIEEVNDLINECVGEEHQ